MLENRGRPRLQSYFRPCALIGAERLHEKSMVIDGLFSMFGSSNLDVRSSEINEELDVVVYDQNFKREMESVFEKDLARARGFTS